MSKKIQIAIAEPCHENWDAMTPDQQGRFCGSCQKQVVDFTNMSDRQLAEFFKKPSTGSVCGRFMTDQLERDIDIPRKRLPWIKYFFTIALPALFLSKASAQKRTMGVVARPQVKDTAKIITVTERRTLGEVSPVCIEPANDKPALFDTPVAPGEYIKGKVVNEKGEPVPFASIQTNKAGEGLITDENGDFMLKTAWLKKGRSVTISSVGYKSETLTGGEKTYLAGEMIVQLKTNNVLEEVVITATGMIRQGGYRLGGARRVQRDNLVTFTKTEEPKLITETKLPMEETKLLVYPNPVASGAAVNLSFTKLDEGYYQLQLISLAGQLIQQKEIWIDAEARLLNLDMPTVAAGTYFIILASKTTGKKYNQKFIVQ